MDVHDALRRLNTVCPDYQDVWRQRQTWYRAEGLGPTEEFIQTGNLADWVAERTAAKDFSCFAALFAVVEDLLLAGSHEVRELVTIGLLEDIQLGLGDRHTTLDEADELLEFFGPRTREAWALVSSWRERPR